MGDPSCSLLVLLRRFVLLRRRQHYSPCRSGSSSSAGRWRRPAQAAVLADCVAHVILLQILVLLAQEDRDEAGLAHIPCRLRQERSRKTTAALSAKTAATAAAAAQRLLWIADLINWASWLAAAVTDRGGEEWPSTPPPHKNSAIHQNQACCRRTEVTERLPVLARRTARVEGAVRGQPRLFALQARVAAQQTDLFNVLR